LRCFVVQVVFLDECKPWGICDHYPKIRFPIDTNKVMKAVPHSFSLSIAVAFSHTSRPLNFSIKY
ncbi:MAG: hypothetical protein AB2735_11400, partial [Candidatus Thiodiazotropha taylori]